jgi:glycosyltransferase involved in cell wall biosynthesis
METVRVMMVTGGYAPELSSGGLQSRAVAAVLGDRIEARILTTSSDPALAPHAVVDGRRVSRVHIDVRQPLSRILATARMAIAIARHIRHVDLVHVQGYSSKNILVTTLARAFGRPIVQHLQTAGHDEPTAIAGKGRLAWWAFSTADRYLSVSPGLTAAYLAAGLPADRIQQAPNGVDADRFRPATAAERAALRATLGLPGGRPLILFVGVLAPDKQPDALFEAWLRLQDEPAHVSTLVFVGSTSPRQFEVDAGLAADIRRRADERGLGGRVIFVPPTNAVQDYFRAADVFAMPSIREGLPIALLEAMACGLPCVASRLPGATDVMVEDGVNGRLVPPRDVSALSAALRTTLADSVAAERMGAAARRTVEERYTTTQVAELWLAAYRHVLRGRPG